MSLARSTQFEAAVSLLARICAIEELSEGAVVLDIETLEFRDWGRDIYEARLDAQTDIAVELGEIASGGGDGEPVQAAAEALAAALNAALEKIPTLIEIAERGGAPASDYRAALAAGHRHLGQGEEARALGT